MDLSMDWWRSLKIHGPNLIRIQLGATDVAFDISWAVLRDEQMSNGWPFSLLNDEQMSNKVGVEHQPVSKKSFRWSSYILIWGDHHSKWSYFSPKILTSIRRFGTNRTLTRLWLHFFNFHPYLGNITILTNLFSDGLKAPTRLMLSNDPVKDFPKSSEHIFVPKLRCITDSSAVWNSIYSFSHNHGSVENGYIWKVAILLEIHPFLTSMIMGGSVLRIPTLDLHLCFFWFRHQKSLANRKGNPS